MKQLIDKSVLVAEIEKRLHQEPFLKKNVHDAYTFGLESVLKFLDTLEVKEMDLEGISKHYALNNSPWDDCMVEIQDAFKDGFELGLKTKQYE